MPYLQTSKPFTQPDSVHAIEDALFSLRQPVWVGNSSSGEANQQVFLEALPQILSVLSASCTMRLQLA
jgi:hypothetical protein